VTSDPQAVSLLQKSLAALTGSTSLTDATLTATAQRIAGSTNETGTATLKATALGDSRVDQSFPSGNWSEIRNHAFSRFALFSISSPIGTSRRCRAPEIL
jgi:hypothetical protein